MLLPFPHLVDVQLYILQDSTCILWSDIPLGERYLILLWEVIQIPFVTYQTLWCKPYEITECKLLNELVKHPSVITGWVGGVAHSPLCIETWYLEWQHSPHKAWANGCSVDSETQPTVFIMQSYAAQTSPSHPMTPDPCIHQSSLSIESASLWLLCNG